MRAAEAADESIETGVSVTVDGAGSDGWQKKVKEPAAAVAAVVSVADVNCADSSNCCWWVVRAMLAVDWPAYC